MSVTQRLAVALQFTDAFTGTPVPVPLEVSIPALQWRAFFWRPDGTYRFVTTGVIPAGSFAVTVSVPGGKYVNWEAFQVDLPRTTPAAPPVSAADYLVSRPLWPTPRYRLPYGETAVVGRLASSASSSVDRLRVTVFEAAVFPPPLAPYTRTDGNGRFVFRLPLLRKQFVGTSSVSTASLGIDVRDALDNSLTVTPAGAFEVRLGRAAVLNFNLL